MACPDCRQGPCARCLAETRPDGVTFSKLGIYGTEMHVPNCGSQELVRVMACAVIDEDLRRKGIVR